MIDNVGKLRQALIDLLYEELGGDSEFDIEGGFHPIRDRAEELIDWAATGIEVFICLWCNKSGQACEECNLFETRTLAKEIVERVKEVYSVS